MRKFWIYIVALLFVAGAVAAIILAVKESRGHDDNNSSATSTVTSNKTNLAAKKACDIFTLNDAKQLLDGNVKGGESNPPASSSDLTVSTCSYTQDNGNSQPVSSSASASLLLRHPITSEGTTSNQNAFGTFRPAGVQEVTGYGDSAYWDSEHGQLNILKNNNWYILSYGPSTPADRTLDQAKQLADLLIAKL